jgi:hypothetical protein
MNNLAITFKAVHRNDEALQLFEKALQFRRRVLPAHHPQIGQSMMNLSSALCTVSRFTDALAMSGTAVDFFRQHMPPGHPELGGCKVFAAAAL